MCACFCFDLPISCRTVSSMPLYTSQTRFLQRDISETIPVGAVINTQGCNYSMIETNRVNKYARWERQRNKNTKRNLPKEEVPCYGIRWIVAITPVGTVINTQGCNYSMIETNKMNKYARWKWQRNKNTKRNPPKEKVSCSQPFVSIFRASANMRTRQRRRGTCANVTLARSRLSLNVPSWRVFFPRDRKTLNCHEIRETSRCSCLFYIYSWYNLYS